MDATLLVLRLVLAGVFGLAAVTKLADLPGSRAAMEGFGLPKRLAAPAGLALPLGELATALLLLFVATSWWGALAGLVLMLAFVAGIGYSLSQGRTPDCHCFGQVHSEPIGRGTLIRNGVLALLAGVLVLRGPDGQGTSLAGWVDDVSTIEGVLLGLAALTLVALAAMGWFLVHLLKQSGRLLVRIDALEAGVGAGESAPATGVPAAAGPPAPGLPVGAPAPAFSLAGLHGETSTLGALRAADKPLLLLFTSPSCGPCNALLPDVGRWQRDHGGTLTIALLSEGAVEANRGKAGEHGLIHVLLQERREVADAYQATGTPAAVVVRPDGTVGSPLALGTDAIRSLLARTVGVAAADAMPLQLVGANGSNGAKANGANDTHGTHVPPVRAASLGTGAPAPALALPDLDGRTVRLADLRGDPVLVLFWNPGCGFCARMLDDLKAWEADPPAGPPTLLVVSTGDIETNRAMGLRSPVLLDTGFATGTAFGASGTPSAMLVDAEGGVASAVAVGAPAVLAMLRGDAPRADGAGDGGAAPRTPMVGDAAPVLRLPDLNGTTLDLADLSGTRTLILFWNPSCGYCERMLDDLRAWEAKPPKRAPKLLVVSTGDVAANRAMGLRSPVVLDQGFATGTAFGASGTPSAVLIDARGNIATPVAVGAEAVLALAAGRDQRVVTA